MLISTDIHPKSNIIYIAAIIIKIINKEKKEQFDILDLYNKYKKEDKLIPFYLFLRAIIWLRMLKFIKDITDEGNICI